MEFLDTIIKCVLEFIRWKDTAMFFLKFSNQQIYASRLCLLVKLSSGVVSRRMDHRNRQFSAGREFLSGVRRFPNPPKT